MQVTCENNKRLDRSLMADDDQIKTLIENNSHYTNCQRISKDRCKSFTHAWLRVRYDV